MVAFKGRAHPLYGHGSPTGTTQPTLHVASGKPVTRGFVFICQPAPACSAPSLVPSFWTFPQPTMLGTTKAVWMLQLHLQHTVLQHYGPELLRPWQAMSLVNFGQTVLFISASHVFLPTS